MRSLINLIEGVSISDIIDNKNGIGQVPDNQNVDYKGLRVRMKPSTFLRLAAPIGDEDRGSLPFLIDHLKNGGKIGAPFLDISIPYAEWDKGDLSRPAKVVTHEGRHRMVAIQKVFGDDPVEVHLFFRHDIKARDITPEWREALRSEMFIEKTSVTLEGPLFG